MDNICFFIGSRDTPESLFPAICSAVERCIEAFGVSEFVVGQYGNFDRLSAQAVIAAKAQHPGIRLTLLLPYHPAERPVQPDAGFNGSFYPPDMETVPRRAAILRANQWMIDHSRHLIAHPGHAGGNSRKLIEYAEGKTFITVQKI